MNATSRFLPSAISPFWVAGPSARIWPSMIRSPSLTMTFWLTEVPWLERANLARRYVMYVPSSLAVVM